jgi:hypothetical protein
MRSRRRSRVTLFEKLSVRKLPKLEDKRVWLVLAHLLGTHGHDESVFDKLDMLYADLGYPEEMRPFGPYAPAHEGKHDSETTRARILTEWRNYLTRAEATFRERESPCKNGIDDW